MGSSKPWFRYHVSALDDPKVQHLGDALFKAWINLLCVAAKNDGKIPSLGDAVFGLRMSEENVRSMVAELANAGLLDPVQGGYYQPHNWDGRQYSHDHSTDRVRRHRERKNDAVGDEKPQAPGPKRDETVSRNGAKRFPETHQSRADESRAEINDDEEGEPAPAAAVRARDPSDRERQRMALAILPRLLTDFLTAMPPRKGGHPKKATEAAFCAAILDGQDANTIIAAAEGYAAEAERAGTAGSAQIIAADAWLIARPWASKRPAWQRSAGYALAQEVASIAGRGDDFEMTGWGGAAQRAFKASVAAEYAGNLTIRPISYGQVVKPIGVCEGDCF